MKISGTVSYLHQKLSVSYIFGVVILVVTSDYFGIPMYQLFQLWECALGTSEKVVKLIHPLICCSDTERSLVTFTYFILQLGVIMSHCLFSETIKHLDFVVNWFSNKLLYLVQFTLLFVFSISFRRQSRCIGSAHLSPSGTDEKRCISLIQPQSLLLVFCILLTLCRFFSVECFRFYLMQIEL